MSTDIKDVELRIADPGVFTPRGNDYNEPVTAWSARAVMRLIEPLERELGDFQNGVAALQKDIDRARSHAGHTEEAGEVCAVDCKGCLDPIGALIDQVNEYRDEMFRRGREIESLRSAADTLKLEARTHAQEARTANATINEIYQVVSGATGEVGNWHGTEPVRERIAELEAAANRAVEVVKRKRDELKRMAEIAPDSYAAVGALAAANEILAELEGAK